MGFDRPIDPDAKPPDEDSSVNRLSTISENKEEKTRVESKIRVEFAMNGNKGPAVNVAAVLKKTIGMIYKADPSMKIKARDEYEGTIGKLSEFPTSNKNFMKFFEVHEDKWSNRTNVIVGFKVEISTDIENLKHQNRGELMNELQDNNIWLKKHSFKTMKIVKIGLLYKKHTGFTWRPDVEETMKKHLAYQHPDTDIPNFVIQNGRPYVPTYKGKKYSMNALMVLCGVDEADELSTLMMQTKFPQGTCGIYSPLRVKDKTILPRIAMAQNAFEQSVKTVTVFGVHEDCLYGHVTMYDNTMVTGAKKTLAEYIMNRATDEKGNPMILSIERTIKSESRGKWHFLCANAEHQECVEMFLENNLANLYSACDNTPTTDCYFGKPRISGGDVRSVAASYVSALTDLPELVESDEDKSNTSVTRAPKRIKGRSIMVQAASEKIYASKPRGSWVDKVIAGTATAGASTATTVSSPDPGNKSCTNSIHSAGQSTLTGQTKQDITLANRLESYKRETEQQMQELRKSIAVLKDQNKKTQERMEQQADVLETLLDKLTLTEDKIGIVDGHNKIRMEKLDNNIGLMMQHMGLIGHKIKTPTSSPERKRKNKRSNTQVMQSNTPPRSNDVDVSMESNSYGALADEDEEEDEDDMLASDEEVATLDGEDDESQSSDSGSSNESSRAHE
jgi:hypothetical protein